MTTLQQNSAESGCNAQGCHCQESLPIIGEKLATIEKTQQFQPKFFNKCQSKVFHL